MAAVVAEKTCTKCPEPRLPGSRSTWCRQHKNEWQREYRAGARRQKRVPSPVRTAAGCLLWQGYVDDEGYGRVTVAGRSDYVHRVAWRQERGPIPDALTVDHLCEVTTCMEITHLDLCSRGENTLRYYERRAA